MWMSTALLSASTVIVLIHVEEAICVQATDNFEPALASAPVPRYPGGGISAALVL